MSRFSRYAAFLVTLVALFGAAIGGRVTAQPDTPADHRQATLYRYLKAHPETASEA